MRSTIYAILFAVAVISLTVIFTNVGNRQVNPSVSPPPAVSIENGTQVITITARGGYSPRLVVASSSLPTILRIVTKGTFDCSSSMVIKQLDYRGNLPPTGTTDISVPIHTAGTELTGVCAMGMYSFVVRFE